MAARRRPTRATQHRALLNAHRGQYEALLAFQGGGCGICGKPPPEHRRHALDHDHKGMFVRGILCTGCNMRLTDRSTPEWLAGALAYVTNPPYKEFSNYG